MFGYALGYLRRLLRLLNVRITRETRGTGAQSNNDNNELTDVSWTAVGGTIFEFSYEILIYSLGCDGHDQ